MLAHGSLSAERPAGTTLEPTDIPALCQRLDEYAQIARDNGDSDSAKDIREAAARLRHLTGQRDPLTQADIALGLTQPRQCGVCGVRDIPRGVEWPYWHEGKPVHPHCSAGGPVVPAGYCAECLTGGELIPQRECRVHGGKTGEPTDEQIEAVRQWFIGKHACWFTTSTLREVFQVANGVEREK